MCFCVKLLGPFLDKFLNNFWFSFGRLLGARSGPRPAQEAPRWAPEGHQDLQSTENLHLQKLQKSYWFFKILGVQGRPRQPWRSQEAAQEAPEELQDLKENELKNGPDFYQSSN